MNGANTSRLERVRNPQGRADWLLAGVLDRVVSNASNPLAALVYQELRPHVERALTRELGPGSRRGRKIRDAVKMLAEARRTA